MPFESSWPRMGTRGLGRNAAIVVLATVLAAIGLKRCLEPARFEADPHPRSVVLTVRRSIQAIPATGTSRYRVRFLRIPDLPGQRVVSETFSEGPHERGVDPGGNWIGWDVPSPTEPREFFLETRIEVENAGLSAPPRQLRETEPPNGFLGPDTFRQIDDPQVRSWAAASEITDTLDVLRSHWRTLVSRMRYTGWDPLDRGAAFAVRAHGGDCSEFADLFAALARVRGIPARRVNGWTLDGTLAQRHAWTEVWLPSRGWTAFDPTWGATANARFETVSTARAAIGWTLSGPEMGQQPYESWRWWGDPPIFRWHDSAWISNPTR